MLHAKVGTVVPCGPDGCANYFAVAVPPAVDPAFYRRFAFLVRLENMKEVGCRFTLDDLDSRTWDELIVLAQERAFMDSVIATARHEKEAQRDRHESYTPGVQAEVNAARAQLGVPPPGHSLFK